MADERRDEFYVGYRDTPPGVRRFVNVVVPVLLWIMVVVNAAALVAMRDPGDAVWSTASTQRVTGVLRAEPYPMLVTDDGRSVLLVEMGKVGAQARTRELGGAVVTATGYPLSRGDWSMLELVPGDEAIAAEEGALGSVVVEPAEAVELEGEILDAKCFLGAMKPGDGMAHRACAALCVRGGIPPLLGVATDDGASIDLFLLEGEAGARFPDEWTRWMGRPVRLSGDLSRIGPTPVVRVRDIEPL